MLVVIIFVLLFVSGGGQNVRTLCSESELGYYVCRWNGVGVYRLPPEARIIKFRRFFRPAIMELTANLTTLILDNTNYDCDNFDSVPNRIFNSIICVSNFPRTIL